MHRSLQCCWVPLRFELLRSSFLYTRELHVSRLSFFEVRNHLILCFIADVNTSQPDKKSIMTYVMCLFQSLPYSSLDDASFDFSDSGSLASPITEQPAVRLAERFQIEEPLI